ncbi:transporter associated domain-containing protein, partial [Microbacterium aurantiacum]
LRPDEVRDRTGILVPEGEVYDTVGGYIMSVLERIPAVGDRVSIDDGQLEVHRMDGRRVDRVRFTPSPVPLAAPGSPRAAESKAGERR